jgi:RHS repeat-associated protein
LLACPRPDPAADGGLPLHRGRYDEETGLSTSIRRAYSGTLGRFLQADPIATQGGINLYAYPFDVRPRSVPAAPVL